MILAKFKQVPTRPTAFVELAYDDSSSAVTCVVTEKKMKDMVNTVARWNGRVLEFSYPVYDDKTKKVEQKWFPWDQHKHWSNEIEGLCYRILLASDVGCPGQARVDFPAAFTSPLWKDLWQEMVQLHAVASIMLT